MTLNVKCVFVKIVILCLSYMTSTIYGFRLTNMPSQEVALQLNYTRKRVEIVM